MRFKFWSILREEVYICTSLIGKDDSELKIETTNCGQMVQRLSEDKCQALFKELETFGVRHGDQAVRNITYNANLGYFCIIDFEFATILEEGYDQGPSRVLNLIGKILKHQKMEFKVVLFRRID